MGKLIGIFSLLLCIGTVIGILQLNKSLFSHPISHTNNTIDSFMLQAEYRRYDETGQLHFTLSAQSMQHYRLHDQAYFTKPHLSGYTAERIPWQVDADYGKTEHGVEELHFWDNVVLMQLSYPRHPDTTTIHTQAVTVYPDRSYAQTPEFVTISRPNSTAHGRGMQADFKNGMIKLLSQVTGTYEPKADKD